MKDLEALVGGRVEATSYDDRVRLRLGAASGDGGSGVVAELVLETEFRLRDTDGEYHEMRPGTGSALAPVLDLFGQSVTRVGVSADGSFVVDFDAGSLLWIGADAGYGVRHAPSA
ncbi:MULTISPECIES: DUF6188 family protein [unclassified Streptomyces]|uniref:DUF6188 family protein n=1 Tax=unclassified Streptomyces TaxID=2593676 RepID=UPI00035C38FE|nr:DUF6188 family protein [Streptomyces sp. BoleA5]MYX37080.1 hypothetical protein [Streptomyces sp. SID8377]